MDIKKIFSNFTPNNASVNSPSKNNESPLKYNPPANQNNSETFVKYGIPEILDNAVSKYGIPDQPETIEKYAIVDYQGPIEKYAIVDYHGPIEKYAIVEIAEETPDLQDNLNHVSKKKPRPVSFETLLEFFRRFFKR